jgi:CRP-like cAMP-binding protein
MDVESFTQLIQRYPSEIFTKGQTILLKDDTPHAVYVIETGVVRAYIITRDGAERLVAVHTKGEDIPAGFGFGLTGHSEYFYEAHTKCTIRFVPPEAFEKYFKSDPVAMFHWHKRATQLLLATFSRINALEQPKAGDKIAFMLYYTAKQLGVRMRPYKSRFELTMTQQEIADSLGLTRETTGSELKKLELKHLISHSRKRYILYMERLREYLEERS